MNIPWIDQIKTTGTMNMGFAMVLTAALTAFIQTNGVSLMEMFAKPVTMQPSFKEFNTRQTCFPKTG